jgi:hypothetical protein
MTRARMSHSPDASHSCRSPVRSRRTTVTRVRVHRDVQRVRNEFAAIVKRDPDQSTIVRRWRRMHIAIGESVPHDALLSSLCVANPRDADDAHAGSWEAVVSTHLRRRSSAMLCLVHIACRRRDARTAGARDKPIHAPSDSASRIARNSLRYSGYFCERKRATRWFSRSFFT